ncbi:MAG: thiol:disulfide interchange protein DsbA/DsbL [Betaproteobacteria bacterium]
MKRRDFSICALATVVAGSAMWSPARAQSRRPQAGWEYFQLAKRVPVEAPAGTIEVVEFFWYNCPHCNAFEPSLEAWQKSLPADVTLRRIPVGFRDEFVPQQRLFFTLQAMGLVDKLHAKVFAAIHGEHLDLTRGKTIAAWVTQQGVDGAKFASIYDSKEVGDRVSQATSLQDAYGVAGVPALGVAGRFYTDGSMAGSMARVLQVVDYLVADVRSAK